MSNVLLRIISSSKSEQTIPVTQSHIISAEKGASYSLIDASTEQPIDGLVLKKQGHALIIEVDGEVLAQIDEFYRPGQQATFNTGGISSSGDTIFISSTDSAADDAGVVWQASEISGLAAGDETGVSTTGLVLGGLAVVGVAAALSSSGGGGGSDRDVTVPDVTPPPVAPVPPPVVADATIVVFDLVGGTSSDHSDREFKAGVQYDIYIRVHSSSETLNTGGESGTGSWGMWSDAGTLDGDDIVHFVGNGMPISGRGGNPVASIAANLIGKYTMLTITGSALTMQEDGIGKRYKGTQTGTVDLWNGAAQAGFISAGHADFASTMPGSIMTTQGLA